MRAVPSDSKNKTKPKPKTKATTHGHFPSPEARSGAQAPYPRSGGRPRLGALDGDAHQDDGPRSAVRDQRYGGDRHRAQLPSRHRHPRHRAAGFQRRPHRSPAQVRAGTRAHAVHRDFGPARGAPREPRAAGGLRGALPQANRAERARGAARQTDPRPKVSLAQPEGSPSAQASPWAQPFAAGRCLKLSTSEGGMTPRMRGPCSTMSSTTLRNAPGGTSLVPLIHAATTAGETPRYMAIGITPSAISAARWTARMWIRLPTRISTGGEDTPLASASAGFFPRHGPGGPRRRPCAPA